MTDVEKAAERSEDTISTLTALGSGHPEGIPNSSGSATKSQSKVDGGLKAWLTLVGSCASLFCAFGQMSSFGTFQTYYAHHQLQHLSASTISWIGSVQFWVFFFSVSHSKTLFTASYINFRSHRVVSLAGCSMPLAPVPSFSLERYCYHFLQ